jgi:hypothetical protein
MRKLPLIFSGLLFAFPAAAQEAEPSTPPETKAEPKDEAPPAAKPVVAKPAAAPAAAEPPAPKSKAATTASLTSVSGPAAAANDDSWKFEYHGYIRAPMRVGMGKRDTPGAGQSSTTLHSPLIPDDQYLGWQSTPHNKTDWAELFLSLGNSWAKGTVSIQGYGFAQAAFSNPPSQLGISDGYVDLTPDLGYENVRLAWRVGAFSNKYGSAGKYDAGEYDTYMFGRIHNAGEALHIDYDIDEQNSLWFEHGIGAKKPDPNQYNNARFTMLHHAHLGFKHNETMQFSAHYLNSWTQAEDTGSIDATGTSVSGIPDGKMWVAGADMRFDLAAFGYFYGAYSHVGLDNAITVSRAIDVVHASGGGEFGLGVVENYLGPGCVGAGGLMHQYYPTGAAGCSRGNGSVDTLLAQYEFSLTDFLQQSSGGQKFWGDGQDLYLKLYGMYNKVKSPDYAANDGIHKLKFGADLAFAALPWMTAAVRFDRLQPNSRIPEQSFGILSPRLVFKSKWNTHEAITVQYSHYFYNQRTCTAIATPATGTTAAVNATPADGIVYTKGEEYCVQPPSSPVPPDGFGANYGAQAGQRGAPSTRPDENVFKVEATMWW